MRPTDDCVCFFSLKEIMMMMIVNDDNKQTIANLIMFFTDLSSQTYRRLI